MKANQLTPALRRAERQGRTKSDYASGTALRRRPFPGRNAFRATTVLLPDPSNAVGVEGPITSKQRQTVLECLRRKQPIERIAVMPGQSGNADGVVLRDTQETNAVFPNAAIQDL